MQTMTDLDRDHYGPTRPIKTQGGLDYILDRPQPEWTDSVKQVSHLEQLVRGFNEMGRKRNPKRSRLKEIMRHWPETDAYLAFRITLQKVIPECGLNLDIDEPVIYRALGDVFGDGTEESGRRFTEEHGSTPNGLRAEQPEPNSGTPTDIPLDVFWGKWVYALAEASGESTQREMLAEAFRNMKHPEFLAEVLWTNTTLYCGGSLQTKAIGNFYNLDDPKACWRSVGDVPEFFLQANRGEASPEMRPHVEHNTMKANSTSATAVDNELDHSEWLAQTKYDGARLFVHSDGSEVRAYSSGFKDVTEALPELEELDLPECEFIFDAEATPYDEDGNVVPFENIMTRLTRSGSIDASDFDTNVVFKFFDCPHWRGRDITDRKYTDRFTIVRSVFDPDNVARTGENLEDTFHSAVENGHEGLVLKRKDGWYEPGGRYDQWLKWKPEPETIDCKVLDAQTGSGRISDRMGSLKLGLEWQGDIEYVGWVGTGFSDSERMEFWTDYETGDLEGQVIEVAFEEFQLGGDTWGLRFPSFERRRPEGDVDSLERAARLQNREDEFREWAESHTPDEDDEEDGLGELFG